MKKCLICGYTEEERVIHKITIIRLQKPINLCASCVYDIAWYPILKHKGFFSKTDDYRKVLTDLVKERGFFKR